MSTSTTGSSIEATPKPPSEDHPEEQTKHGPGGQAALLRQIALHRPSSGCSQS